MVVDRGLFVLATEIADHQRGGALIKPERGRKVAALVEGAGGLAQVGQLLGGLKRTRRADRSQQHRRNGDQPPEPQTCEPPHGTPDARWLTICRDTAW